MEESARAGSSDNMTAMLVQFTEDGAEGGEGEVVPAEAEAGAAPYLASGFWWAAGGNKAVQTSGGGAGGGGAGESTHAQAKVEEMTAQPEPTEAEVLRYTVVTLLLHCC
jgi:hypothetical protein